MNKSCRSYARALAALCVAASIAGCAAPGTPAPDYAAIVAAPDRSEADRSND